MCSQANAPPNTRLSPTWPQLPARSSTGRTPELLSQAGPDTHRGGFAMGCGARPRAGIPMGIGVRVLEPWGSNGCLLAAGPVPAGHSVPWGCGELVEGCGVREGEPALGTAGNPLASQEEKSYHVGPPCLLGVPVRCRPHVTSQRTPGL